MCPLDSETDPQIVLFPVQLSGFCFLPGVFEVLNKETYSPLSVLGVWWLDQRFSFQFLPGFFQPLFKESRFLLLVLGISGLDHQDHAFRCLPFVKKRTIEKVGRIKITKSTHNKESSRRKFLKLCYCKIWKLKEFLCINQGFKQRVLTWLIDWSLFLDLNNFHDSPLPSPAPFLLH